MRSAASQSTAVRRAPLISVCAADIAGIHHEVTKSSVADTEN
jgi:hypothetical protein